MPMFCYIFVDGGSKCPIIMNKIGEFPVKNSRIIKTFFALLVELCHFTVG